MKRVDKITVWGDPDWIFRHNRNIQYQAEKIERGCTADVVGLSFPGEEIYFLGREDDKYNQTRWFWLQNQNLVLEFYSHGFHWDSLQIVREAHLPGEVRKNLTRARKAISPIGEKYEAVSD